MGLFQATSSRQPDWKQFLNIHEATWLPATFASNQIASKLPGVWWPLMRLLTFTVIVEGGTIISCHSGDRKSRHIKGTMRAATMNTLSKVTPSYLQHHKLSLMRQDVYNRDGIGCSKRVLQLKVNDSMIG